MGKRNCKYWTRQEDDTLKELIERGATVQEILKAFDYRSYRSVYLKMQRMTSTDKKTDNAIRLQNKSVREGICVLYIDKMQGKSNNPIGRVANSCNFSNEEVQQCLIECHADGTYRKILRRINIHNEEVKELCKNSNFGLLI